MVSQAENAGTVASGDTAGQALAGGGGEPVGTGVGGPEERRRKTWTWRWTTPRPTSDEDDDADEDDEATRTTPRRPVPMRPPLRWTWRISSRKAR